MSNGTIGSIYLIVAALVFLLGFVILRESPRERLNRATALMLFVAGLGSVLGAVGFVLESFSAARAGSNDLLRSFNYLWELFFPSLLYFACVFPTENRLIRRVPFAILWIFAPHAFHLIFMILQTQGPLWGKLAATLAKGELGAKAVAYGRIPLELTFRFHQILFSMVNLVYIAAALTLLWRSYRRAANALLRTQVRTVFVGLAACAGFYAFAVPLPTLFNQALDPAARSSLIVAALLSGSGSIAYSMVRHRFLDANLIARKSILYAVTSGFLLAVYLTIIRQIDALLETVRGYDTTIFQTAMLLLALVLFQPVFSWLEDALDRFFLRDRGDHRTLIRRMSGEVLTVLDLDELAEKVLATLREGLPARTTVLLIAPPGATPIARGSGGGVDLAAIEAIPRDVLTRLFTGVELLRRGETRALAEERGLLEAAGPLLATEPYLLFPLHHAGDFLGVIALGRKITETRYTAEEVALLQTLANQSSVAVKNAFLYRENLAKTILEEELAVARRIQQQFLPRSLPRTPRFDLAALNVQTYQVGGDYYDLVDAGDGSYLVAIADVAGKGVSAALLASMVQASIRTQAQDGKPVGEMMGRLNRLVHEATPDDRFATCFLARVGGSGLGLSFSNAGHNYPILLAATGECRLLEEGGLPLGISADVVYGEVAATLAPGDALLLYTDGITDARNLAGEDYGEERLLRLTGSLPRRLTADELIRAVADDVSRFTGGADQADDITLVALRAR
ncbi:MAG TPA: SpoIIE family protein phosphatase [Candidatus Eisenbacteria bacterium]